MIGPLLALALAADGSAPPEGLALWSPEQVVSFDQALYLLSTGASCAELQVVDGAGAPLGFACEGIGPAEGGEVLRVRPETSWPAGTIALSRSGFVGEIRLGTVADAVPAATVALPVERTVTDATVSFAICHDGELIAVVRSAQEPAAVEGDARILAPGEDRIWFGADNGLWPEAAPEASAVFWFASFDGTGARTPWVADEVRLTGPGLVRTDLRFGADPEAGRCPDPDTPWSLGEEVDALGGATPRDPPSAAEEEASGCGRGAAGWLLLPLVGLGRRRRE